MPKSLCALSGRVLPGTLGNLAREQRVLQVRGSTMLLYQHNSSLTSPFQWLTLRVRCTAFVSHSSIELDEQHGAEQVLCIVHTQAMIATAVRTAVHMMRHLAHILYKNAPPRILQCSVDPTLSAALVCCC